MDEKTLLVRNAVKDFLSSESESFNKITDEKLNKSAETYKTLLNNFLERKLNFLVMATDIKFTDQKMDGNIIFRNDTNLPQIINIKSCQ